jgi:hypothetical protein
MGPTHSSGIVGRIVSVTQVGDAASVQLSFDPKDRPYGWIDFHNLVRINGVQKITNKTATPAAGRSRGRAHRLGRRRARAHLLGTGESVETPMVSQMEDFTSSRAFRVTHGLCRSQHHALRRRPSDDLRRPLLAARGSFAHLPIHGLEDLGFVPRAEAGAFIAERNTAPGASDRDPGSGYPRLSLGPGRRHQGPVSIFDRRLSTEAVRRGRGALHIIDGGG